MYTLATVTNEPTKLGIRAVRAILPSVVNAAAEGECFVITNHGAERCAIVSMDDLQFLQEQRAAKPAKRRASK